MAPLDLVTLAICAGLVAATGELAALAVRRFALREVLHLSGNVAWMAPLNDAVVFGLLGVVLVVLTSALARAKLFRAVVIALSCAVGILTVLLLPLDAGNGRLAALIVAAVAYPVLGRALRAGPRRAGIFACVFAALYAMLLAIPRLHPVAYLVLAAGGGARLTQLLEARPRLIAGARRAALVMAGAYCVAGLVLAARYMLGERRAGAALPAASTGARNVIVIIWDTVRASSLGLYGYGRATSPQLDKLAATGITFDRAFAPAPWTLTSHASMFTGHFPFELSADIRTPLDAAYPTVAEVLRDDGFATAGFVANGYYCNVENGLSRGFAHYEDFVVSPSEILISTTFGRALAAAPRVRKLVGYYDVVARRNADDINASFLRWLDRRPQRPFFAFLNYYDAHLPYLPPAPWQSRFGRQDVLDLVVLDHSRTRTAELVGRGRMSRAQRQSLADAYDGGIAYMDDRLGQLIDSLRRRDLLRNTVVVVTSDHGEHQGEHGLFGHNRSLYTQEVLVPLVISIPGDSISPRRVATPASLRDLGATVLDLARARPSTVLAGSSLARFWSPDGVTAAAPDTVLSQYAQLDLRSLAVDRFHFIRGPGAKVQLYDVVQDAGETRDLAATTEGAAWIARISATYRAALDAVPRHPPDEASRRQ